MEAEFRLARRQNDGATLREHLQAAWHATGRMPDELDVPDVPPCCTGLWTHFMALNAARGGTGFGPAPIGWSMLRDYAACIGVEFSAWEAETLMDMDRAALVAAMAKD